MPIARFELEDGRIARFEVPDGTTPEQAQALIAEHLAANPLPAKGQRDLPPGVTPSDAGAGRGTVRPHGPTLREKLFDPNVRPFAPKIEQDGPPTPTTVQRRGGRSSQQPYVAMGGEGGGAGRGSVQPPLAQDHGLADAQGNPITPEQAQQQRLAGDPFRGDWSVGKDFAGGVETVKAIAQGVPAFGAAVDYRAAGDTLADLDAIDAGQQPQRTLARIQGPSGPPRLGDPNPVVRSYLTGTPEQRQQIRASLSQSLQRDEGFIQDAAKLVQQYRQEAQRQTGQLPEFTDVRSVQDFGVWLVRNGVNASPSLAASMVGAALGPLGLAATSVGTAVGDLTQERLAAGQERADPLRFHTADRIADAMQQRGPALAQHVADNVGATAALAPIYAAGDFLGPAGTLAKGVMRKVAAGGVKEALQRGATSMPREVAEEFAGEGLVQESANIAGEIAAGERSSELTAEDAKRVFNAGMAGAAAAPGGVAVNTGIEAVRAYRDRPEAQIANAINEAATQFGLSPRAAAAMRDQANTMQPEEAAAFAERAFDGFERRGLTRKPGAGAGFRSILDEQINAGAQPASSSDERDGGPSAEAPAPFTEPEGDFTGLDTPAVDDAAHAAATSPNNDLPQPTEGQKEAGNYRKGHIKVAGLDISVENPNGSERSGVGKDGTPWSVTMNDHYGYIRGTVGKDKDHIDVFVKPGTAPDYDGPVVVIDQKNEAGGFDEHKVMLGYGSRDEALQAYRSNYSPGWDGVLSMHDMDMPAFKDWLATGDHKQPAAKWRTHADAVDRTRPDAGRPAGEGPADGGAGAGADGLVQRQQPAGGADGTARAAVRPADAGNGPGDAGRGNGDQALSYPNRKLGFERARVPAGDEYDGRGMAQIALANAQPGDRFPMGSVVATVQKVGAKSITLEVDGKKRVITPDSATWEQLVRDVDGRITASQHGVDALDVLKALQRDPAFTRDERGLPMLRDVQPAPAAPESAAATTPGASDGEIQGQGQGQGRRQEVLTPPAQAAASAPARRPRAKVARPVMGSMVLGEIVNALGGIGPEIRADLSSQAQRERVNPKTGKKTTYTAWRGDGLLFRKGAPTDLTEIARVLEETGYLPAGTLERDYLDATARVQDIIKAEIANPGSTRRVGDADAIDAEMRQREDMERLAWEQKQQDALDEFLHGELDIEAADLPADPEAHNTALELARLLDEAAEAGVDVDALKEDFFSSADPEWSQTDYEARLAEAIRDAAARARRQAGGDAAGTARADDSVGRPAGRDQDGAARDGPAGPDQAVRPEGEDRPGLSLQAESEADAQAKAEREAAAVEADRKARDAEQARLKKEADAREARARADDTVDDFQLGQSAEQQLSGQNDLFGAAPAPAPEAQPQNEPQPEPGTDVLVMPADPAVLAAALSQAASEDERAAAVFKPQDIEPVSLPRIMGGKVPAGVEFMTPEQAKAKVDEWKAEAARQGDKSSNWNKVVISLFDASGVLAQPWHEAGYRVFTYDLQTGADIAEFNAENLLEQHGNDEVFAILAQPPCTDFASSGAQWWKAKDEDGRTEASNELVRQVLRTVELFRPPVWVMENPVGRMQAQNKLPDPLLQMDPWHFGDPYSKRTLLWGRFNPNLPTAMVEPVEGSKIHRMSSSAKYERSLTPEGFAYALFMANNAEAMGPAGRLAAEFAGVERPLFERALAAGNDERAIKEAIEDSYYESDLETVREILGDMGGEPEPAPDLSGRNEAPPAKNRPARTAGQDLRREDGDSEAVRQAKADAMDALADLADIFAKKAGRLNITPEEEQRLMPVLTRLFDASFRLGYLKFKEAARWVLDTIRERLGEDVADSLTLDHLQGAYIGMAGKYREQGADRPAVVAAVESLDEIASAQNAPQEPDHVPNTPADLERDRGDAAAEDAAVEPDVPADAGGTAWVDGVPGGGAAAPRGGRPGDAGVPAGGAAAGGERGDQPVHRGQRQAAPSLFDAGAGDGERGDDPGLDGLAPETVPASDVAASAEGGLEHAAKLTRQRAAEKIAVKDGDLENIRATLPYLLPGQQEDVHKAEIRFAKPDGYGMLYTNGTGTGKTFTGLGIVKRFERQGKTNTLVVVPDEKIMADWVDSARALGLTITPLKDTKDAGRGITITTYANLGDNDALVTRDWDLIVPDEAHMLMQSADGAQTKALDALRAISLHPRGRHDRFAMLNRDDLDELARLSEQIDLNSRRINDLDTMAEVVSSLRSENETLEKQWHALNKKLSAERERVYHDVAARQGAKRTRVAALSATPFAYVPTVDWADGYLFDYEEDYPYDRTSSRYNQPDPQQHFLITHFGYRMRTGKLTQPDAKVNTGLMERQFNAWLRKRGALSSRVLDVDADYDRRFILVESAIGNQIDAAIKFISERRREAAKGDGPNGWEWLEASLQDRFYGKTGHLTRRYLLEAIKAKEVVAEIRAHMQLGRKVVVFHDFKKGGSVNPFDFPQRQVPEAIDGADPAELAKAQAKVRAYNEAAAAFAAKFPNLVGGELLKGLISPIQRFTQEFPGVLLINGDEKRADLLERYRRFNDDATGPVVALVQSAKNKGWSGHDTTGKHQRVLFNLGLPTQPTMTIQQEGRIYRVGQKTDAVMRYLNTGTDWERWAFASTIASRASTAENLGMGEQARALKESFIAAFEESGSFPAGHEGEGKGGKERDLAAQAALTEWDRAIAFYWGTQKKDSRTKAQEGKDYFATPEPLGLKMVQWADPRSGEDALEPSGGHGAIARWFPDTMNRTAVEQSSALASRMALVFDGKIIEGDFEDLHVSNKFDAIAMNPPFGTAGRTAIDHVAKAATHLREGGRLVALIPQGPSADAKFDKWFYGEEERPIKPLATLNLWSGPDDLYRGDVVKSEDARTPEGTVDSVQGDFALLKLRERSGLFPVRLDSIFNFARTGPRTKKVRPAEDLHLVAQVQLPAVTFSRAGTGVMTRVVVIEKLPKDASLPYTGRTIDLRGAESIEELFNGLENLDLPARQKEEVPDVPEVAKTGAVVVEELQELAQSTRGEARKMMDAAVQALQATDPRMAAEKVAMAIRQSDHEAFKTQAKKMQRRLAAMTPGSREARTDAARAGAALAEQQGVELVEHITGKGKKLKGVIRTDLTPAQAKEIDAYTFRKDGGWFIRAEHLPTLMQKHPPAGGIAAEEAAVYSVREPEGSRDIPLDLFPETLNAQAQAEPVPPAARADRGRARRQGAGAGDLPAPTALSVRQDPFLPGLYHVSSQLIEVGRRELPVAQVRNWDDAAAALAALNRYAVEHFDVLVTDAAGKPLALAGIFKGAITQASVYPGTILAEVLRIEGAAFAWGVHNHPSGVENLSQADEFLNQTLAGTFSASSVKWMGLAAVAGGRFKAVHADGATFSSGTTGDGGPRVSVPIVERIIEGGNKGPVIDNPTAAKRIAAEVSGGKPGLIFTDAQQRVTAWVPVRPQDMGKLREDGRFDRLINSASQAAASTALIVNPGRAMNSDVLDNIASALSKAGVRTLDAIDPTTGESLAVKGLNPRDIGVVMSRGVRPSSGVDPAALRSMVDAIRSQWADAPAVEVVNTTWDLPSDIVAALRSMNAVGSVRALVMPDTGKVWLIADRLGTADEAQFALFHEVLGHWGLRKILGGDAYAREMALLRMANPTLRAEADQWMRRNGGGEISVRVQRGMSFDDAAREVRALSVEEALADRAGLGQPIAGWRLLMERLQKALRRIGLASVADWLEARTEAETAGLLLRARRAVEQGGEPVSYSMQTAMASRDLQLSRAAPTESAEFRRWFGESKVVDPDGKPLVVYHGTASADIFEFLPRSQSGGANTKRSKELVDWFRSQQLKNARIGYMTFRSGSFFSPDPNYAGKYTGEDGGVMYPVYIRAENPIYFDQRTKEVSGVDPTKTPDALIMHVGGKINEVAVLDPAQVKSAIGNDGGFDVASPNILLSRKPNHTPEQRAALAKAGVRNARVSMRDGLRQWWTRAMGMLQARNELAAAMGDEIRQGMLDQFYGIRRAVQRDVGNLPVEQDPYVSARLANGGTSSVMRALLLHGQARWANNGQHLEKVPGTKGLLDILAPLGDDVNDWFGWMIGNRAERLMREGRERNFTDDDIKALKSLATPANRAKFQQAAVEYAAFKRSVLDVAQAAGLINPDTRKAWDFADYIPFYRQVDERSTFSPTGRRGLAGQSSGIRTLRGGEAALNDPMENLLMNFSRLIDASLKNQALRKTIGVLNAAGSDAVHKIGYSMSSELIPAGQVAKLLLEVGTPQQVLDVIPPEAFDGMAKMWAIQAPSDPDVIRLMVGGKPQFYRVDDPLLLKALTSFVPFDFPGLGVMRWFKRLLTSTVTASPEFVARNFIRDSAAAQAITRDGFNPGKSFAGVVKSYQESGGFEPMLFAGASFQGGNVTGADPEATGKAMRRALRAKGLQGSALNKFMASIIDNPLRPWEKYREMSEAVENANREAVFEAAARAGKSATAAAFEAKDLMDFNLRGSWAAYQLLADVVPFLNARVQGLYRLGRSNPRRLMTVGLMMMAASLLLAWANAGEDEYEALPDWDKDTYWHFWIGGEHFRLPKPFELGVVFATIPERVYRTLAGLDTGRKLGARVWANLRDQLAFDPVPQMIRPVLNVWTNKDTFRDAPIETESDEGKLPHLRYSDSTSETLRGLLAGTAPLTDAAGLSPKQAEYLINAYTGAAGFYALALSDIAVRQIIGAPPQPALRADEVPVVKAFYRTDPGRSTVWESDLYQMRQAVDEVYRSVEALKRQYQLEKAQELTEANLDKLRARRVLASAAAQLSALNRQRDRIYADKDMGPEEKRQRLDQLAEQRAAIARSAVEHPAVMEAF